MHTPFARWKKAEKEEGREAKGVKLKSVVKGRRQQQMDSDLQAVDILYLKMRNQSVETSSPQAQACIRKVVGTRDEVKASNSTAEHTDRLVQVL